MSEAEISNMLEDGKISDVLKTQLVCEDEIDQIQKTVSKHVAEVSNLAKQNAEMKNKMIKQHKELQEKMEIFETLKQEEAKLGAEQSQICVDKAEVVKLVTQKIKSQE